MDWTTATRLLEVLGPYAWPVVVFIVALMFRSELRAVLSRVRKGKFLGQEFELDPQVREFQRAVEAAKRESPAVGGPLAASIETPLQTPSPTSEADEIAQLLRIAAENPAVAIMQLAALLEREVRLLTASQGIGRTTGADIRSVVEKLGREGVLPPSTRNSLDIFWDIRNQIVHGRGEPDDRETLSVLDLGMSLLKLIRAVPHEVARVHTPDVELFADASGASRAEGVGLILAVSSPGGVRVDNRIFPTMRTGYYEVGTRVAWQWNLGRVWPRTWYREPQSGSLKLGWESSGEFVGEMVPE